MNTPDHYCDVCGRQLGWGGHWELASELIETWQLSPHWKDLFEQREGLGCLGCGSALRYRYLAKVMLDQLGAIRFGYRDFGSYAESDHFRGLAVAEINGCGPLHQCLRRNPSLAYSEFASEDPSVTSEDLLGLSYEDDRFDMVVTSDTLEHVPHLETALNEIERILKPGGRHIFTVPVVWDGRTTRQRAALEGDRVVHLLPPSYHGQWEERKQDRLVFHEFGDDVHAYLTTTGVTLSTIQDTSNPSLTVFVAVKKPAMQRNR